MWILLGTAITTGFFDSLNPSAIAQQMLLQAMVKNKRHTWFFIFGIGTANLALGLAVYYGIATWVSGLLYKAASLYPRHVCTAALCAGALCVFVGIRLILKTRFHTKDGMGEAAGAKTPARLSPLSLFFLGAAFCMVELTSAFPYFGFLAVLTSYHFTFLPVLLFIMIYNLMYILPLIIVYFGYNALQGTAIIQRIEYGLDKVSSYVVPTVVTVLGILLVCYGGCAFV